MKHRRGSAGRGRALLLAAGTLWAAAVTAGSQDAASAVRSLWDAAAGASVRAVVRPELSGSGDALSLPSVLALRQMPLLYSAGDGSLWRGGTDAGNGMEVDTGPESGTETDTAPETEQGKAVETDSQESTETSVEDAAPVPLREESVVPEDTADTEEADIGEMDAGNGNAGERDSLRPWWEEADLSRHEEAPTYQPAVDNGMKSRTLVPSGPSGYTVAGRVYISSSRKGSLDVSALLDTFDAHLTGGAPEVLILHTHGSEAYTPLPGTEVVWSGDHRTTDPRYSVVKCGDVMAAAFAEAGISVLHDRTLYDYPEYTGSYNRSLAAINSYLVQYPSIHFILDVHRDSISDSAGNQYKVISDIEGVGAAAQMTLVMGSDGAGDPHPNWMENLKLAVAIQEQICGKYPTLMRPILLRNTRYNQHATTGSLLVEVGASGNAPEEAQLAARLFAEEMAEVLQARTK